MLSQGSDVVNNSRVTFAIPYATAGFPPSAPPVPGSGVLTASWSDLVWAAIFVGRWPRDVFAHGGYSFFDAVHRAGVIFSSLREYNGRLVKSALYHDLDRSEKVVSSYYIGMTCAKLFADRLLDVPYLVHVDRYQQAYAVRFRAGRTRPDLIGPDRVGRWIVAEAKGRSGRADGTALTRVAEQKSAVRSIDGNPPFIAVGSVSSFDRDVLSLRVVDPDKFTEDAVDYAVDRRAFLSAYYDPLVAFLRGGGSDSSTEDVVARRLDAADVTLGMLRPLYDAVTEQSAKLTDPGSLELGIAPGAMRDGTVVRLGESWDESRQAEDVDLEALS